MTGIINGLFAGRAGINSHGAAIAVASDNISNSSTIAFKSSRGEFEDIISGGQGAGRVIGSGSSMRYVTSIFTQGTLEFTSRPLDLAIDGNGYFVLADGAQRFYTRAGNFKVDDSGNLIDQSGKAVLGFPQNGDGSLQPLNVRSSNTQSNIFTRNVDIVGNLDSGATAFNGQAGIPVVDGASTTTFADLNDAAAYSTVVDVFDSLGNRHTVTMFFFKTATPGEFIGRAYVKNEEVDNPLGAVTGLPRLLQDAGGNSDFTMQFTSEGTLNEAASTVVRDLVTPWNNGANATQVINFNFGGFSQFASPNNILSINQDGQGIGTVVSVDIDPGGRIFAQLDNGQNTVIGTVGLVNFANPEGLKRIGANLLQQTTASGEPIVGTPAQGTFGAIQSGSLELSTVDLASEFVKIITLQRGFQASSRIITTIDGLLNEIINLA